LKAVEEQKAIEYVSINENEESGVTISESIKTVCESGEMKKMKAMKEKRKYLIMSANESAMKASKASA